MNSSAPAVRLWFGLLVVCGLLTGPRVGADVLTFQEGINRYAGTQDTYLHGADPSTSFGDAPTVLVDSSDGVLFAAPVHGLLRFEGIIGNAADQIPPRARINSVTLRLTSTASAGNSLDTVSVHRMIAKWDELSTWDGLKDGVVPDDLEAFARADITFIPSAKVPFVVDLSSAGLASAVQSWVNGNLLNLGWAILPTGPDNYRFDSSEALFATNRPLLRVDFTPSVPPKILSEPQDQTVLVGTRVGFSVAASGVVPLTYQWRFNGVPLLFANNASYILPAASAADAGKYSVEVTSGSSSVVSRDALLTVLAGAQVCTAFNSGQPAGTKVFGDAKVDSSGGVGQSGVLKLTTSANNQLGSFLFPSPNGAIPVEAFSTSFKALMGRGTDPPADGFSFNFASDLPDAAFGEEGAGTGLTIAFDNFDNGNGEAPAIDVILGGKIIGHAKAFLTRSDFVDVAIALKPDGSLDVIYDGQLIYDNFATGYVPKGGRFGFGARTGALTEDHFIDNLCLAVFPANTPPSISNIADRVINEDGTTGPVAFTVGDVETPAGNLTLSFNSTNTALVPVGNIVLGGSGANRTVTVTPVANGFGTTRITMTVTDGNQAAASATFLVTVNSVNDPPTISSIAQQIINANSSTAPLPFTIGDLETPATALNISANSTNTALVAFGNIVFGGSGSNRTVTITPVANQVGTTLITVNVTDANEATASATFLVTVRGVAPTITQQPQSQTVAVGSIAGFFVTATGIAPISYQWRHGGEVVPAATSPSLGLISVNLSQQGIYAVAVTGPFGTTVSSNATLTVTGCTNGPGPVIKTQPVDQTVTGCGAVTFEVVATGATALRYQWFVNGTALDGATGPSYTKAFVTAADGNSRYTVIVTDNCGSITSQPATLKVNPDTVPPQILSAVPDCQSNKVTVTFSEPLDSKSAEIAGSYQIFVPGTAPLVIVRALLLPDGRTVCLFLSPNSPLRTSITYTLTVNNVRDVCGNAVSQSSQTTFVCQPDICVEIFCPKNILVDCQGPLGTPVKYSVFATNNCSSNMIVICKPPADTLFHLGTTGVECTATGNNQTARCGFTVTVRDRTDPVLHCPSGMVVETTSSEGALVSYQAPATDDCDTNVVVDCKPPSGSFFGLGTITVVCSARDSSTNTARCTFPVTVVKQPCERGNKGQEFWLTFPGNYPDPVNPLQLSLCLVGAPNTTGFVEIAEPFFSTPFTIPPGAMSTTVLLPATAELGAANDVVLKNGIHVTANGPVAVYGLSHLAYSTDGYLGLPTGTLGTDYIVMTFGNLHTGVPELNGTQFALVACADDTQVTITVPVDTGERRAGVPYTITLHSGQTYQLRNTNDGPADLSGTIVQADKPVALFGSHACANIPGKDQWFCNYLVEQLLPTSRGGTSFFTVPLATRTGGDTFRLLAINDGTQVSVNGVALAPLSRGKFHERKLAAPARITADAPIFVTQYSHSSDADGVKNSDPFMVLVPHTGQYSADNMVCVPTNNFPKNYLNVVVPTAAAGSLRIDGVLPLAAFSVIASSGYSGAQIPVSKGPHSVTASAPLGVIVYGYGEYDGYGYPGAFFFADTTPPTLTCPATNLTVQLTASNFGGCVVVLPDFRRETRVTDDCDLPKPVVLTQTPPPGTQLGAGVYVVTVSAMDAVGNIGKCEITVNVIDPTPLLLTCPTNLVVSCQGTAGTVVNYPVSARTQCQTNLPVVCIPPTGSIFQLGTTSVVCTATSANGQTATCAFPVTVTCHKIGVSISRGTVNLGFATQKGSIYFLEFKDSLAERNWKVLRTFEGTGANASFQESLGSFPSRYFQLRVQ